MSSLSEYMYVQHITPGAQGDQKASDSLGTGISNGC